MAALVRLLAGGVVKVKLHEQIQYKSTAKCMTGWTYA